MPRLIINLSFSRSLLTYGDINDFHMSIQCFYERDTLEESKKDLNISPVQAPVSDDTRISITLKICRCRRDRLLNRFWHLQKLEASLSLDFPRQISRVRSTRGRGYLTPRKRKINIVVTPCCT